MAIHVLGIRHHGPGSAKNVKRFLERLKPDIVLVEGPPEADGILQWVGNPELIPPVAILCYQPDNPQQSCFYPFAEFSPEWQAISYARKNNIHVRFMDLPAANQFAIEEEKRKAAEAESKLKQKQEESAEKEPDGSPLSNYRCTQKAVSSKDPLHSTAIHSYTMNSSLAEAEEKETPPLPVRRDPVSYLAQAAGFDDAEKWWEHMFEHRQEDSDIFEAVSEAMDALRKDLPETDNELERLREAHMRKTIRQAEKEMFQTIAVICGAWHAPSLQNMPKAKDDNDLLKALPKVKVECTWIPWTYGRLSFYSGYGAGISSPGWYDHIWHFPKDDGSKWMAKVARLFREKQMDTSVAHVIEAIRLANSLASMRNLYIPGLEEYNEATLSVLCNGEEIMMSLLQKELIVSNKIGTVPTEIPKPPLQLDIEKHQKKLRLPPTADWKDYTLDLRKETDLERSIFLHRLNLLNIKWAFRSDITGKGTFKEQWRLQWDPAFSIDIIDKGTWGNTVEEAAAQYTVKLAADSGALPMVCALLEQTIPAELPVTIEMLINQINNLAAASADILQLLQVIPNLVGISRYGNVRKTDSEMVLGIISSLVSRICISLPSVCTAVDEEASGHLLNLLARLNDAISLLEDQGMMEDWQKTLSLIAHANNTASVIAGYSTRLLFDHKLISAEELVKSFYYAMSGTSAAQVAAAWLEGFLRAGGTILLIDEDLWNLVNNWVEQLTAELFTQVLPLLRRTFSNFSAVERKKLGEKLKQSGKAVARSTDTNLDEERAKKGIGVVMQLFGYKK